MRGYKAFNKDWTCRGKAYKAGETYTEDGSPVLCEHGIHFCPNLINVFRYYEYDKEHTIVAEVKAVGDIVKGKNKCCTNKLHIIREVPWKEIQKKKEKAHCDEKIRSAIMGTILLDVALISFAQVGILCRMIVSVFWLVLLNAMLYDVNQYRIEIIGRELKKTEIIIPIIMNISIIICCLI